MRIQKGLFLALLVFATIILSCLIYWISDVMRKDIQLTHQDTEDKTNTKTVDHDGWSEHRSGTGKRKQPHVLFIITDDQGYNTVGYNGVTNIKTPVIDSLAKTGLILDNYYVQPICTPTRGQLFSGRHQVLDNMKQEGIRPGCKNLFEIHTGLTTVIFPGVRTALPLDTPTIADKLKEAGYSTNLVGKWHLGYYTQSHLPTRRGFDSFFGVLNGHIGHFNYITVSNIGKGYDLYDGENPANLKSYSGTYSTTLFADQAIKIIKKHDTGKPLFLVVSFTAPHEPLEVPEKYSKPYVDASGKLTKEQKYAGMISCIDEAVGNITDAFKRKGLWNDTLMIYTSDNGGKQKIRNVNYPLRGQKSNLYEGGIKVPGFVHSVLLNDSVKGTISKELLHVTDWFPTLASLGQANVDNTKDLYGYDVRKTILNGQKSPRNEILHDIHIKKMREGDPLFNDTFDTRITASLRVGDWKILTGYPGPYPKSNKTGNREHLQLYNIHNDPRENHDLSLSRLDIVKSMLDRLEFHRKTAVPSLKYELDKRASPKYHNGFWGPWM